MRWHKIYGLCLRHVYLIRSSFPRILDLIYWPSVQVFLWGFISKFFTISSSYYNNTVGIILTAAILYDFLFRSSISYNMMFLEEIWSRNFTNLFIAPIKISEIITALTLSPFYFFTFSSLYIWDKLGFICNFWPIKIWTFFWKYSLGQFILFSSPRLYILSNWNITRVTSINC